MDKKEQKVTFHFYQGRMHAEDGRTVAQVIQALQHPDGPPCHDLAADSFEIRQLTGNGHPLRGEFAKLRQRDIPHAGSPGGSERDLDLEENEGLVEKNFFHYWTDRDLLVYQKQGNGSGASRLAQYLSRCRGQTVTFDPVLQPDPMRRLMKGSVRTRVADIRIARPTNPEVFRGLGFNEGIMRILEEAGGISLALEIRGDGRSADPGQRFLLDRLKTALAALIDQGTVSKAVLQVEDTETPDCTSIDLINDRMYSVQTVEKLGRYFVPGSMHAALLAAYQERLSQLDELFAYGNGRVT